MRKIAGLLVLICVFSCLPSIVLAGDIKLPYSDPGGLYRIEALGEYDGRVEGYRVVALKHEKFQDESISKNFNLHTRGFGHALSSAVNFLYTNRMIKGRLNIVPINNYCPDGSVNREIWIIK